MFRDVYKDRKVLYLYFVPAFLYCLYNNLSFLNLATFDPTTYNLLLQLRVVITAILFQVRQAFENIGKQNPVIPNSFQVIFKKQLSDKQWLSLFLLTIGCMLKQINFTTNTNEQEYKSSTKSGALGFNINAVFILVQVCCSCLAGVYNEYLLKHTGANVNIFIQNVYMYLDSIICNVLVLIVKGDISDAFAGVNFTKVFHLNVLIIMINNAAIGIITSFFLKTLNSILKTFASALELLLTALFSYLLFSIPIYLNTMLAICTVLYAVYLYSQNPVSNVSPHVARSPEEHEAKENLLMEEV